MRKVRLSPLHSARSSRSNFACWSALRTMNAQLGMTSNGFDELCDVLLDSTSNVSEEELMTAWHRSCTCGGDDTGSLFSSAAGDTEVLGEARDAVVRTIFTTFYELDAATLRLDGAPKSLVSSPRVPPEDLSIAFSAVFATSDVLGGGACETVFDLFDTDNSGELSEGELCEFTLAVLKMAHAWERHSGEELRKLKTVRAVKARAEGKNPCTAAVTLHTPASEVALRLGEQSLAMAKRMLREMDADRDGAVSFGEFEVWFERKTAVKLDPSVRDHRGYPRREGSEGSSLSHSCDVNSSSSAVGEGPLGEKQLGSVPPPLVGAGTGRDGYARVLPPSVPPPSVPPPRVPPPQVEPPRVEEEPDWESSY